jgi:hypothetical protein
MVAKIILTAAEEFLINYHHAIANELIPKNVIQSDAELIDAINEVKPVKFEEVADNKLKNSELWSSYQACSQGFHKLKDNKDLQSELQALQKIYDDNYVLEVGFEAEVKNKMRSDLPAPFTVMYGSLISFCILNPKEKSDSNLKRRRSSQDISFD